MLRALLAVLLFVRGDPGVDEPRQLLAALRVPDDCDCLPFSAYREEKEKNPSLCLTACPSNSVLSSSTPTPLSWMDRP